MSRILSSPHVHTTYCDGLSSVEEMILSALDHGFESLGFSGHACQNFDKRYSMTAAAERAYIREVTAMRRKYAGRITIWLGMERDQWSYAQREPYDYVIGSVHYLRDGQAYVTVDGDPAALDDYCHRRFDGDGIALAGEYYRAISEYVCQYKPEIIGHLDVIRKNNTGSKYFNTLSPVYREIVQKALEAMASSKAVMEVNTGGMARGGLDTPYPELFALRQWHKLGGEVILASDCHKADDIAFGYEKGLSVIREAGYDHALALGRGCSLFERYQI
jgi:histidinol-phosphatase (PHP family)